MYRQSDPGERFIGQANTNLIVFLVLRVVAEPVLAAFDVQPDASGELLGTVGGQMDNQVI